MVVVNKIKKYQYVDLFYFIFGLDYEKAVLAF